MVTVLGALAFIVALCAPTTLVSATKTAARITPAAANWPTPVTNTTVGDQKLRWEPIADLLTSEGNGALTSDSTGTVLFAFGLFFVFRVINRLTGRNTATFTCLLLASHPYFYRLTAIPADSWPLC